MHFIGRSRARTPSMQLRCEVIRLRYQRPINEMCASNLTPLRSRGARADQAAQLKPALVRGLEQRRGKKGRSGDSLGGGLTLGTFCWGRNAEVASFAA